jgi:hypothetical protein
LNGIFAAAANGSADAAGCRVLVDAGPVRVDLAALQVALGQLDSGVSLACALPLRDKRFRRILGMTALPFRLRRIERAIREAGAVVVGRYGVDPSMEQPMCVYELGTPAATYADRRLRPPSRAAVIRRMLSLWCGCDPALAAVVVVGRKP